jgi:hypothetical protein
MARGGRRAGAGRKPGPRRPVVIGMDGLRRPSFVLPALPEEPMADLEGLAAPPGDLSEAEAEAWRQLAPYALKERTLTASRTPGFRKLCQEWVYCAALDEKIRELGIASADSDRLLKRLNDWKKLLRASMGDFSLKSFGKPAVAEKPKSAANPWGSLAAKTS